MQEFLDRRSPARRAYRELATVLFTDIVGSTGQAAELGDRRWRELLDTTTNGVRRVCAFPWTRSRHGPATVPRHLRRAARRFAAPRRLEAVRPSGSTSGPGVHTGECEVSGERSAGSRCTSARVSRRCRRGRVFVSSTVKDLVAGSGLVFEDRGRHALKGLPDTWSIFRVVASLQSAGVDGTGGFEGHVRLRSSKAAVERGAATMRLRLPQRLTRSAVTSITSARVRQAYSGGMGSPVPAPTFLAGQSGSGQCWCAHRLRDAAVSVIDCSSRAGRVFRDQWRALGCRHPGRPLGPGFLAFRNTMGSLGYEVGSTLELELRVADVNSEATYSERATELVAFRPDVLVASGTAPTMALAKAVMTPPKDSIPVVFIGVGTPVEIGLVESLARPGRNLTGFASFSPDLASKRLELLKDVAPTVARPAILWNPADADDGMEVAIMQAASSRYGFTLRPVEVRAAAEVTPSIEAAVRDGADAIVLASKITALLRPLPFSR